MVEMSVAELLPEALRDQSDQYTKGTDTMDMVRFKTAAAAQSR